MSPVGRRIEVQGVVQGVGFRPFVYRLAHAAGVRGRVYNDGRGVVIDAFGEPLLLERFTEALEREPPACASVHGLRSRPLVDAAPEGFTIETSQGGSKGATPLAPDRAPCRECLAELLDPSDRRYRYPFLNCTACGPRFTIVERTPYERAHTSMAGFTMCPACQHEHDDPRSRRFHAQPNACPRCGPQLRLLAAGGEPIEGDPLHHAAVALREGCIVAIKGLGGYQLATLAHDAKALLRLRAGKRRPCKPLAVMVSDEAMARALAEPSEEELVLLRSPQAPIVVVRARPGALPQGVAPGYASVGLMLPSTPLHHLLLREVGAPLVMTSGNRSGEPLAIDDACARRQLAGLAERWLVHDRPIVRRADDSVVRVIAGAPSVLRRARGWVPRSITLPVRSPAPLLACGSQLGCAPCLLVDDLAFLAPHVGDLDGVETLEAYDAAVHELIARVGVEPRVLVHDLHPDYGSTRWAKAHAAARGLRCLAVQHHHAHAAAVLAEHGHAGPVHALVYDGVGLGDDGAAWGGELLHVEAGEAARWGTFRPVRLPGGDRAVREIWRLAVAVLHDAFDGEPPAVPGLDGIEPARLAAVAQLLRQDVRCPAAHGVGRWFDAFAVLGLGLTTATHEGEAAMRWEQAASGCDPAAPLPWAIDAARAPWQIDLRPAVRAFVRRRAHGEAVGTLAAAFHETLAEASAALLERARVRGGVRPVVLAGGCFANARLTARIMAHAPTTPWLRPRQIPPGDGGLALGQALVAAVRLQSESEQERVPCA